MTTIYANGCSFVFGQELFDNDPLNNKNKDQAFPSLIGAVNDSWSGSSNQAIMNRTMDYCRYYPVDVAVIAWSHWERQNTFNSHPRLDRMDQYTIKAGTHPDVYGSYFLNETMMREQTKNIVESTWHWLKAHSIKPVFFFSVEHMADVNVELMLDDHWTFAYSKEHNGDEGRMPGKHPNLDSHKWIAGKIMDYINA